MGASSACVTARLVLGGARVCRLARIGRDFPSRRPYAAFSLLELTVALLVTAVLASIAGITYVTISGGVQRLSAAPTLALVQLESRRAVEGQFPREYAATLPSELASPPFPPGVTVTEGPSSAPSVVSVFRSSSTVMVFAAGSSGGCLVLVDSLTAPPVWVSDRDLLECAASQVAPAVLLLSGGTATEPIQAGLA